MRKLIFLALFAPLVLAGPVAVGQGKGMGAGPGDQIYGSRMMTEQERNEYRERMQKAATEQERERIRAEHHALMQDRARQRGIQLPDEPPAGRGMGPGGGMGRRGG